VTFKKHPVTFEPVPDEAAQVVQWRYVNPRMAEWPAADFIVGNPPFIGASAMRAALGDGYAEALRRNWADVPESADFVMYWWHKAALTVRAGAARRFGFITTNSLRQTFNRRVVQMALDGATVNTNVASADAGHAGGLMLPNAQKSAPGTARTGLPALSLAYAIADHPWVDGANGAAVRIAMTVAAPSGGEGRLLTVQSEHEGVDGEVLVDLSERRGLLHGDLRLGANVAGAKALRANLDLSNRGVQLFGAGFIVTREEAAALLPLPAGEDGGEGSPAHTSLIREYRNGRDLMSSPRDVLVIDAFGLSAEQLRERYPAVFQWLLERVKPERDQNNRATYRDNWWIFGEPRRVLRLQLKGLARYIVTVETARQRVFQFLDAQVLPDNKLVAVALADALQLGVLTSVAHVPWSLAAGSWLGVGNDSVYVKSRCFETFPFPADDTGLTPELADRIRSLAEQLDAHRKARQAAHEAVTLTGLYNVLDKLRRGEALSAKDKTLHEQGLVSVLQSLHDELDAAVLAAYGWSDLGHVPWADEAARAAWTEALLERLVALNAKRAAEEGAGTVRWLRPEFQDPARRAAAAATAALAPEPQQVGIDGVESAEQAASDAAAMSATQAADGSAAGGASATPSAAAASAAAQPWPATLPEQVRAVAQVLQASPAPLALGAVEAAFKGKGPWKKGLPRILETLEALGRARQEGGGWRG
jgi:hypothetical protein